ncbi:MAG: dTDP-glucose 4,6-dehydratase [Bdellovibrionales bacterium]|nr:dTDP-glucose 4,6-dehydratase [Bdellovibrionales bacterium]NQZ19605.1 dTDP-glucose 4,6-dehydratase [Bdellovibrionales bacterium]
MKHYIITGAAGFIGSNFLRLIDQTEEFSQGYHFHVVDSLTYAGHWPSISDLFDKDHFSFHQVDIRDLKALETVFKCKPEAVLHFAAESHVDRSIDTPSLFIETNVLGTANLLKLSQEYRAQDFKFLQVGTDEVYGSLQLEDPAFTEKHPLQPSSPYSASKASADLLVQSFHHTYGLPTIISRCSNNYGPYQYPEKLIPLMIDKALNDEKLPVYGDGQNIRDWIHVEDHNRAILAILNQGRIGEVYNIGSNMELKNLSIVEMILEKVGKSKDLIEFVTDRPGHDFRYAMNTTKLQSETDWRPQIDFAQGINSTIDWYLNNKDWVSEVKSKMNKNS